MSGNFSTLTVGEIIFGASYDYLTDGQVEIPLNAGQNIVLNNNSLASGYLIYQVHVYKSP